MTLRTFTVLLGSLELTARADVVGKFRPSVTQADPEFCYPAEEPEVEVQSLMLDETDLTDMITDDYVLDAIENQIVVQLDEEWRDGDRATGDER